MKRSLFFYPVFFFFLFSIQSQINISFVNYLSRQNFAREHLAYINKVSATGTGDSVAYLRAKFYLQYPDPNLFLQEYEKSFSLFNKDTNAVNIASVLMLRSEVQLGDYFFKSDRGGNSFYSKSMDYFYNIVDNPLTNDMTAIPEKLQPEFLSYRKFYKRKPFVAGMLSAVVPGLGKLYAGRQKSFTITLITHIIFAARTYESIKVLGIRNPWTIFNLGFSGMFYLSNIYGSFSDMKKVKKERKRQLLIHGSDYYNFNCACTLAP